MPGAAEGPPPTVAAAGSAAARTPPPRHLQHLLSLDDFEPAAARHLPRPLYGYISGGVESNVSLRANRAAFDAWHFVPRVLVDTRGRHQRRSVLGRHYDRPFGIAPMGGTGLAAYQGDAALARAATVLNMPMIQSGASVARLEHVRAISDHTWFQAYLPGDLVVIGALVDRVARAGFDTLVVTVDVPVPGNRENNVRSGYSSPIIPTPRLAWDCALRPRWLVDTFLRTVVRHGLPHLENMGGPRIPLFTRSHTRPQPPRDGLDWSHIAMIRERWKGHFVLKGVLAHADVRRAREIGLDGIIVSNHGGRQLDGTLAPLQALRPLVGEAGGMAVMLDSGIRRGTDVLKALALGADFVFVGRPFLYAAALGGEAGVRHATTLLSNEVDRNMAMLGLCSLDEVGTLELVPASGAGR